MESGSATERKIARSSYPPGYPGDLGPFVALCTAQAVGLCIQHSVQRLFHRAANDLSPARLDLPFIELDQLTQLHHFLA